MWKAVNSKDGSAWCCDNPQCQGHTEPLWFKTLEGFEGFEFSPHFAYHWKKVAK